MFQELSCLAKVPTSPSVHLLPLTTPITLPRRRFDGHVAKPSTNRLSPYAGQTLKGSGDRFRPMVGAFVTGNSVCSAVWSFSSQHQNTDVLGQISTNRSDLALPVPRMVTFEWVQEEPGGTNTAEGELGESRRAVVRCRPICGCFQNPGDIHRFVVVNQGSTFDWKSVTFEHNLHRRRVQLKQWKL